jgi:hypothetical protein
MILKRFEEGRLMQVKKAVIVHRVIEFLKDHAFDLFFKITKVLLPF